MTLVVISFNCTIFFPFFDASIMMECCVCEHSLKVVYLLV